MHEPEAFGVNLAGEEIDPCRIASWLRKACYQAERHRIFSDAEHNRDRCRGSFGGERCDSNGRGSYHGDGTPDGVVDD